jgi:hypothetical protein
MSCLISGLRTGSFTSKVNVKTDKAKNIEMMASQERNSRPNVRVGAGFGQDCGCSRNEDLLLPLCFLSALKIGLYYEGAAHA